MPPSFPFKARSLRIPLWPFRHLQERINSLGLRHGQAAIAHERHPRWFLV